MKVHREETKFQPVVITLETQEEVNELFSWINHASVCPEDSPLFHAYEMLSEFKTKDGFNALEERLRKEYGK